MKPEPITEISFESVLCFGKFVLFTGHRIDRSTVPNGLWIYDIRHGDEGDWTDPVEILPHVLCNYMGSIVSNERFPIDFNESYITMDQDSGDWDYIECLDDEDLWDNYDNIPETLEGYINYNNDTSWDVPDERLTPRIKEVEESIENTLNNHITGLEEVESIENVFNDNNTIEEEN